MRRRSSRRIFTRLLAEQDTLQPEDGQAVLVSAAYLDNLFNGTAYRTDANGITAPLPPARR